MAIFHGTKHDDDLNGTSGNDTFELYKGGEDTAHGGAGIDVFNMGASLDAGDRLDGGADRDMVTIHGDYSAGLVLQDQTIQNIEIVRLGAGFDYNLTFADGNVAAGEKLSINASRLGAGNHLVFDGSAETDGHYVIAGGAGDDTITGGAKADIFHLETGGNDTVHGGGGNDTFDMGAAFTGSDVIDGGTGNDTLILDGDYSGSNLTISDAHVTNIENLDFLTRITSTKTTFITGDIAGGHTLDIDVSLTMASRFFLDLSGATSAAYDITTNGIISAVTFGGNFSSADKFHNTGNQGVLQLNGDYSGGLTLSGANLGGLDKVNFNGDFSYSVSVVGKIGQTSADGFIDLISNVSAGHSVFLDLTQSTAGDLAVTQLGAGDLTVKFAGNFSSSNRIDGSQGTGATTVELDGDYSAGLNFVVVSGATLNHVATLKLDDGFSYKLAMDEGNGGATLTVDATALTAGHTLTFDASEAGSAVAVTGGAGDDTVKFGNNFSNADSFNGGAGNDTLSLNGDYSGGYTFGASQLTNVESIVVAAGHTYGLTMNNANVASGATMTIDASALGSSDQLFFDGTAEADGHFAVISGAGADNLEGGALSDTFDLSRADGAFAYGNGGADTFTVSATLLDNFIDGGAGTDTLVLNGNFSTQTTITAANVENIEALTLLGGTNTYNLVLGGGGVEGTGTFTIDGSAAAAVTLDLTSADTRTYAITGSASADTIKFGTSFLASDTIDGGAGNDTLALSGGDDILLGATTLTSIETLTLTGGSFDIKTNDGNVGVGKTLTVDATALTTAQALTFDGSAEQDGNFVFAFGTNFTASETVTGGAGDDTLSATTGSSFSLAFSGAALSSIETLQLTSHNATTASITGDIADGRTLTIDSTSARLFLDLSAATSSAYDLNITSSLFSNVTFSDNLAASAIIHGDNTSLFLNGDYSGGLALSDVNMSGMAGLTFGGAFSYAVSIDGNIAGSTQLNLFSNVSAGHTVSLDLTQAATSTFDITSATSVKFAGNFVSGNFINGVSVLELDGDYSSGLTFKTFAGGIETLLNVSTLQLDDGFSYKLTMAEDNFGEALTVDASALTAGHTLTFDGSGDSSSLAITGGAGNDSIKFAGNFTASDTFDGGAGNDTLSFDGTYASLALSSTKLASLESLAFTGTHAYTGVTVTGDIAGGSTLSIDASTANSVSIDLSAATSAAYAITGSGGDDTVVFGQNIANVNQGAGQFTTTDTFNGGAGDDMLEFKFNNSGLFLTLQAGTIANVDTLKLDGTFTLILNDGNVAAGETLTVWASGELGNSSNVDGSAETDGAFHFIGEQSGGADAFKGGAGNDLFDMGDNNGVDTLTGNGGNDTFSFNSHFNYARAIVSGGSGSDTLELNGDYTTLALRGDATHITSVETLKFLGGHSYTGVSITGDMADGSTLTIDASAASNLSIDLSAATSAAYAVTGSGGDDTVKYGANFFSTSDTFDGGAGNDTLELNFLNAGNTKNFTANTISNVETIKLDQPMWIVLNDGNVASGQTLTVLDATTNAGGNTVDGSAETNGSFHFVAEQSGGPDVFKGGAGNDLFDMGDNSGTDTLNGNGGNDTFSFNAHFNYIRATVSGGSGSDTLELNGDYTTLALKGDAIHITSVETLKFLGNHSYTGVAFTGDIADGSTLTIDASAAGNIAIDLTAATSSAYAITGSGGNDSIAFGSNFSVSDSIDGGAGNDTVTIAADGIFTFTATTLTNVEDLILNSFDHIHITTNDATVASGATLTVDFSPSSFPPGDYQFDGSAETNGHFNIIGPASAGDYIVTGGALSDTFTLGHDGTPQNNINGGGGDDTLTLTAAGSGDGYFFDGGAGNDTLALTGGGTTATLGLTSVELLTLDDHNWNMTRGDIMVHSGLTLTVDASALTSAHSLTFDGSGSTGGSFAITGGAGHDTITGGSQADTIAGGLGADTLTGGGGADTFSYASLNESNTVNGYDTITDLGPTDSIHVAGGVPTFFAAGNEDTYQGSLDNDLVDFFSHLGAGKYGVVTLTGDTDPLKGHVFLVIDGDGQTGYTAGADYVIDITGSTADPSLIHFI